MRVGIISSGISGKYCLEQLLKDSGFELKIIITLTDDLSYTKSTYTSFDSIAKVNNIEIVKVKDVNSNSVIQKVSEMDLDVIIEMGWSQIIGKEILKIPKFGVIGTHLSKLPHGRGHSPLNWAMINQEKTWGITLYYLTEVVDAGDIIYHSDFLIEERDTIKTLYNKATFLGVKMLLKYLADLKRGNIIRIKQGTLEDSYHKRTPKDGEIKWDTSTSELLAFIKALTKPFPGAYSFLDGNKIYIWEAEATDTTSYYNPGQVIQIIKGRGVEIATKDGSLILKRISIENTFDLWADDIFPEQWVGKLFVEKL